MNQNESELQENNYTESLFESIRHVNDYGEEFWDARELQEALEYKKWDNFKKVINRAIESCRNSENTVEDHFADVRKMVPIGSGAERERSILFCNQNPPTGTYRKL